MVQSSNLELSQWSLDPVKLKAIVEWETPKTVKQVQAFLGFGNFYRRFIKNFSIIAKPLHSLSKKGIKFEWTKPREEAFEELKRAFTSAPVLQHPDPQKPFLVETDSSDFALGAVLSQKGEDGLIHPVAYMSTSLSPAEQNYDIYDKEMLAIIQALETWKIYLEGNPGTTTILTDHKNLEYFTTTKELTRRQARWSEFLSRFNFVIQYRPGSSAGKPDALSRLPQHKATGGSKPVGALLSPAQFISATNLQKIPVFSDSTMEQRIKEAYTQDQSLTSILAFFSEPTSSAPKDVQNRMSLYSLENGLLLREGLCKMIAYWLTRKWL